ncbi:MAG: type II toxin-antitoxin system Phd/YefM family antitoxin [Bacteroidota bacterium]
MAIIKPISDLRNKSNEISTLAHESHEPIYITKNGEGDLVVLSVSHYRSMQKKLELLEKLAVAQAQVVSGEKTKTLKELSATMRKRLNEKKA